MKTKGKDRVLNSEACEVEIPWYSPPACSSLRTFADINWNCLLSKLLYLLMLISKSCKNPFRRVVIGERYLDPCICNNKS